MLDLVLRRTSFVAMLLATAGAASVACETAAAQESPAQDPHPYIGVVTGNDVYVRSGAAESYYPYAKVDERDLVRVIGEKFNWIRVAATGPVFERKEFFGYIIYPTTQPGRFRLEDDGKSGVVLGREDILAPNLNTDHNPSDSWKPIARLEPNTRVTVVETLTENNRTIQKVKLPEVADGWISQAYIRQANDEELLAWRRAVGELPEDATEGQVAAGEAEGKSSSDVLGREASTPPAVSLPPRELPAKPEPTQPTSESIDTPSTPTAQEDETTSSEATPSTQTSSSQRPATSAPAEPATKPETTPATVPSPTTPNASPNGAAEPPRPREERPTSSSPTDPPASQPPSSTTMGEAPADDDSADAAMAEEEAFSRRMENVTVEDLEQAFERLREEPIETAEVEPLRRMYLALATRDDLKKREQRFADARADQLQIWADIQRHRAELAELRERAERTGERTEAARLAADAAADYAAVGKLAASTIYDGERLPMMLRVQDPGTGRTVAYVEPNDELNLISMIGQLVGIVGEKGYDGGLRLNIVQPRRVDLLAPQP